MGYSLTYFRNIPHGRANGLLMEEYFRYNYQDAKPRIELILDALGLQGIDEFGEKMDLLFNQKISLTSDEIALYASQTMKQRSTLNNIRTVSEKDIADIFSRIFG